MPNNDVSGTGLGLAIAQSAADLLQARIGVADGLDEKGVSFTISLRAGSFTAAETALRGR